MVSLTPKQYSFLTTKYDTIYIWNYFKKLMPCAIHSPAKSLSIVFTIVLTLLYGDFSSLRGLYGDSSLWRLFLFTLYGDFSSLRGLFSMETFPLYGASSLCRDFSSLQGLYGDSSLWRLFLFTGTLRGLFSMETFPLYGDSIEKSPRKVPVKRKSLHREESP